MSVPLCGTDAAAGTALKEGMATYLRFVNEAGGVHGRKFQLFASDDAGVPGRTVANTRRMIEEEGVFALLSYYGIQNVESVLPLLSAAGIPLIGAASGADSLREPPHRYLFNIRASYLDEGDAIVTQLDAQGLNEIAVFYQKDSIGQSALAGARAAMARLTMKPAVVAGIDPDTTDLKKAADSSAAARPQAVVMAASVKATAEFIRQMQATGGHKCLVTTA